MAEYFLTPAARSDLAEIRAYLSAAPEAIRSREIDRLEAAFTHAVRFRFIGRHEPELKRRLGQTRSLLSGPYRIYYYPESLPLEIIAVIHGKRDPIAVLKRR